jgi:hypothetical protein
LSYKDQRHTWNDDNRQKALHVPGGTITTYTYRWDGLRTTKADTVTTEKFIYDGQAYLLTTDGSNVLSAVNTNEPAAYGNLVSQRQLVASTWIPIYYHYDHLGSTRQITSAAAAVASTTLPQ